MRFLSRYVHCICLCKVFHNCFASSLCFVFLAFRDAVTGSFLGVPYVLLSRHEELQGKVAFLCQGCAAGRSP
jgi:hypothetical protein